MRLSFLPAPRADRVTRALRAQVSAIRSILLVAERATREPDARAGARAEARRIEHVGDEARRELALALRRSLASHLDREDLYRLSRSIDDVLDNLRDFIRELDLYQVTSLPAIHPVLGAIGSSLEALDAAIAAIATRAPAAMPAVALRKSSSQIRSAYQAALHDVFAKGEVSIELLKTRELLRRLDVVGLRLAEAGAVLADAAMKRE